MSAEESTALAAAADRAFERELLAAGRAQPLESKHTEAAWARFAAGLGTVASAAAVGQMPSVTPAGGGAGEAASPERWLQRFAAAKWLLTGALVGSALTLAWLEQRPKLETPRAALVRPSAAAAASTEPNVPTPEASLAVGAASSQPVASGASLSRRKAPAAATTAPAASLAAEVAALDAARTAIGMGAWGEAQQLLAKYQARFPHGALSADAEVLAIEALAGVGKTADAQRSAKRFLARRPNDPQASRVRWLIRTSVGP